MKGLELKKNREFLGLTQEELAEKLQVSRKTINSYENGANIPPSKMMLLDSFFKERLEGGNEKDINDTNISLDIKKFREKHNLSQSQLADIVKSSIRAVQSWEQGQRNISQSAIRLLELYEAEQNKDYAIAYPSGVGDRNSVKLYDVEASGGFGTFENMISEDKVIGEFVMPSFSSADWLMYVKGSSMYPKYSSGDIIACKQIKDSKFIQWNKVYVLATSEQGFLVKRLMPSEVDNCIKAVSDNKDYPPFDISKDEILGIALVLGVIRME